MILRKIILWLLLCSGLVFGGCDSSDHEKSELNGYEVRHRVYQDGWGQRAIEIQYWTKVEVYKNGAIIESARPMVHAEMLGVFESARPIIQRQPIDVVYLEAQFLEKLNFLYKRIRHFDMEFKKNGDAWVTTKKAP